MRYRYFGSWWRIIRERNPKIRDGLAVFMTRAEFKQVLEMAWAAARETVPTTRKPAPLRTYMAAHDGKEPGRERWVIEGGEDGE